MKVNQPTRPRPGEDKPGRATSRGRRSLFHGMAPTILTMVLASALAAPVSAAVPASPPTLHMLRPGQVGYLVEPLPINVVFVGYEQGGGPRDIDPAGFLADQPELTAALARMPLYFGFVQPTYTVSLLDYRITFADAAFEDAFFGFLSSAGRAAPLSSYQRLYNQEANRSLTIDRSIDIDAPTVESWLVDEAGPGLGIDTTAPTLFFINWFGRGDFQFHSYTKAGEPDTDTGRDFGTQDSRRMIAWGGSPVGAGQLAHRVWFHDLSAGPEFLTQNWDLTNADVDGDAILDYRMPPTWEYGSGDGYRPFTDLSGDLARILRYVFVDALIAPSPLYPPTISAPRLPSDISVDITRITSPGALPARIDATALGDGLEALQPWNAFTVKDQRRIPFAGQIEAVHRCWVTGWLDPTGVGDPCFGGTAPRYAYYDLWKYVTTHLPQFTSTAADYSIPTLVFEIPAAKANPFFRAEADLDPRTGGQSFIVSYETDRLRTLGFGQTDTLLHEVGHHLGLRHVHDGTDYATGIQFVPSGDFFFVWTGDESSTVMSYLGNENDFGQFDRDDMGRWLTTGYLNQANQVLARILSSSRAPRAYGQISAADADAVAAFDAYQRRDYAGGAVLAKRAFDRLLRAAADIQVPIEPQAPSADMKSRSPARFFVDPIPPFGDTRQAPAGPTTREKLPLDLPAFGHPNRVTWVATE